MTRRLLLLGGGHTHVHVLQSLAHEPLADVEVRLVTPFARQLYSGMVPGLVAGHYRVEDCAIALPPLAAAARVHLVEGAAAAIDAAARVVTLADGRRLDYDWLSLDTGAVMRRDRLPGARAHGLFVRPIEHFVRQLDALFERAAQRPLQIALLGGGAAGVELALALRHRLGDGGHAHRITLVTGGPVPLDGYAPAVTRRIARVLSVRGIGVQRAAAVALTAEAIVLDDGRLLPCDQALLATGAESPEWLAGSGLALDERGFVRTGATLQSVSHAEVFAAGDVASRDDAPHPRSGVYAVRAGPPLVRNLRLALAGDAPLPYRPQSRTLNLISTGERCAIAAWGPLSTSGRWVWRWKDRIDRAFVRRYAVDAEAAIATGSA